MALQDLHPVAARVAAQFNERAAMYDADSTYHPPLAAAVLARAAPQPGESVLDVACGTGLVALGAAEAVGSLGRVVGIDLSEGMLQQARTKAEARGVSPWVEWVLDDAENYDSLLARYPEGSFGVITCSAALPLFRDIPAVLEHWRTWLKPGTGRLAFNSFAAPAVFDFGTFCDVAARHGLDITDPFSRMGTRQLVEAACTAAGYSSVTVDEEAKERYIPAESPEQHAQKMWKLATSNPFNPVDETVLPAAELAALYDDVISAISEGCAARFEAGKGVRSPYTVLHVLARP